MAGDPSEKAVSGFVTAPFSKRFKSLRKSEKPEKVEKVEKEQKAAGPNQDEDGQRSMEKTAIPPVPSSTVATAPTPTTNGKVSIDKKRPGSSNHSNPLSLNRFFPTKQQKEKRQAEEQTAKVPPSERLRKAQELHAKQYQVDELLKRLVESGREGVHKEEARKALSSNYAAYDPGKAYRLLEMQLKTEAGHIEPYDPNVTLVGAENREAVTCYLAALLAAMFIRLDAYECMLKPNPQHTPTQRRLCYQIRLWVNMVRTGMLVHIDQMKDLQESLADCGWPDARDLAQQDASEAFANITEALNLPLLTLEVNLFHQGKTDKDDHKVVEERLLNISVPLPSPNAPNGTEVKLEDCLEEYFNTKVEIKRDHTDEKDGPSIANGNTIRIAEGNDDSGECSSPAQMEDEVGPLPFPPLPETSQLSDAPQYSEPEGCTSASFTGSSRPVTRPRTGSAIQRLVLDENSKVAGSADMPGILARTGTKIVKVMTIPAWQIYRLVPFTHRSGKSAEPVTDREVISNLNERPVVGICLKRWNFQDGVAKKSNTVVDIPDSMSLPHYMAAENKLGQDFSPKFKLTLEATVCHRGDSTNSGHYITLLRINPKLLTDNRRHIADPPPDYEEAQWAKFDDLAQDTGGRVVCVDDIKKSLREEMPYLLFYRIEPIIEVPRSSMDDGSNTEPPSYMDSTINVENAGTSNDSTSGKSDSVLPIVSRQGSGYFDNALQSSGPSIRFSLDIPGSRSSWGDDLTGVASRSRRGSLAAQTESGNAPSPAVIPGTNGAVTPGLTTPSQESPAHKLRAVARGFMTRNKSEAHVEGAGESKVMDMINKISRPGSREILKSDFAGDTPPLGSPTTENGPDGAYPRRSYEKKEKRSKGKKKANDKQDSSEKGKAMPDRECSVM
ncbi:Ubiquitin carboxyl-terminal hydrolase 8 [Zalerion maritima]|uniref:ubiquitinyl hydrolase 1 n=1 Tax=Zalerion maritima TaxID=339359 RepID=A0AAD5RR80_9PEZI|nr:Ubiquitin carboxyl-terminal hydrolase 8 [Zalerion maritima]